MAAVAIDAAADYEALLHFLYIAPIGLVQTSLDGEVLMLNPISAQLLMPLSPTSDLSNLFTALGDVAPELEGTVKRFAKPHGLICEARRIRLRARSRGKADPEMLSLTLLKLSETRLMAVLSDVTEQVRRERMLRQNEAWLGAMLAGATDYALLSLDQNGLIDDWNTSIERVTGYGREAVVGKPYSMLYPAGGTTPERMVDQLREADDCGWSLDDGWRVKADASRFFCNAMISPLHTLDDRLHSEMRFNDSGSAAYCMVLRDVTTRRDASLDLLQAASLDHLTGILNRRSFYEAAELELVRWKRCPRPLSLIMFDVGQIKGINDDHGHAAGDQVLKHLAAMLTATFRECDIVARIGGEEFAVLLPSVTLADAHSLASRLLAAVASQSVDLTGGSFPYIVSAGATEMDPSVVDLDVMLSRAERAVQAAQAAGGHRAVLWQPGN